VTCSAVGALSKLSSAPREALHAALGEPHLFLDAPGGARRQAGLHAGLEDACLAYQLLDQVGGGGTG
jgi:hypothetical protein